MGRKINLLYVGYDLRVGGAEDLLKTLAINIDKERYNAAVVTVRHEREPGKEVLAAEIGAAGVEVVEFNMWGWGHVEERQRLIRFMKERRIDVVHSYLYPVDLWASRAARKAGVPAIIYSKLDTYKKKTLLERFIRSLKFNRNADLALAVSSLTRDHLVHYEFILPWKVKQATNPVDTNYFNPSRFSGDVVRKEFGIPANAPVVGNMCRLVGRKGVESFVEACSLVSKAVPDCHFLMVGYGYKEEELKNLVSSLGVKNFIFTGLRRDIAELMAAMDVFLFTPYWGEGLPLVMLEAMSMEKAIVASNVCSNNELIENGVSGLLPTPMSWENGVDTLDADALAAAVISLIRDPETRKKYGRQARESVVARFGVDAVMRQLETIYEDLLKKKGVI